MKKFKFSIHGNQYTVDIHGIQDDIAHLEVNGTVYDVEIQQMRKPSKTPTIVRSAIPEPVKPVIEKRAGGSAHPVMAPLPGSILVIRVQKGDIVEKGQVLLTMEAMKMENKVLSDRAGVVESILVNPGDTVLQGDVLLEIV
jgi:glutaconyl-CoA/methylmalonyl-CoA decarboxylase subunit gamma